MQNLINFGGVEPPALAEARAGLIPVPLEATVSYGGGTSCGPAALILASAQLELYDQELDQRTIEQGIYTHPTVAVSGGVEATLARVEAAAGAELTDGRLPVLLGGEHTVTLGALKALVAHGGSDFTVLALDAHLDLRDEYQGQRLSHACVMRRALEMGLAVCQVGVRSCSRGEMELVQERGLKPVWACQVHQDPGWLEEHLASLAGPLYLSLDIDGLDPSLVPATGTPEPGGLSWWQVCTWLEAVCSRHRVLGLDLVELAPNMLSRASDFTAAKLLYRALGLALRGPQ